MEAGGADSGISAAFYIGGSGGGYFERPAVLGWWGSHTAVYDFRSAAQELFQYALRTLYVGSGVWQEFGWNSIIYVAAISTIDQEMYESAALDGAGRWKKLIYITLPAIAPTIVLLLVMNMGNMLNIGYEKVILMYNSATYSTADIFSTYVYRKGLLSAQYSFASAVGLANSVINVLILSGANYVAKKAADTSIF